jgi:outer membrane protein assembly factor BamB
LLSIILSKVLLALVLILANVAQAQTPGTKKWEFTATGEVQGNLSIGPDGTIYAQSQADPFYEQPRRLYAINPNGTKKWDLPNVNYPWTSDPVIGKDGSIYICESTGYLYAFNPDSTQKWRFQPGESNNRPSQLTAPFISPLTTISTP